MSVPDDVPDDVSDDDYPKTAGVSLNGFHLLITFKHILLFIIIFVSDICFLNWD
jgi:hypothetical protein